MKYLAAALGLTMITCRACAHRFYVRVSTLEGDQDDPVTIDEDREPPIEDPPVVAEAASVQAVAATPAAVERTAEENTVVATVPPEMPEPIPEPAPKRGFRVRLKIRTGRPKVFRAAS